MMLVFDLDDTLYPEASFVDSGFRAVADHLGPVLMADPKEILERLRAVLIADGRGQVFDRVLEDYGALSPALVADALDVYRTHMPDLELFPGVRSMLETLAASGLFLVSDGDPAVQARKIAALEIAPYFTEIYRTWSFGREAGKPSLHCFELILGITGGTWADLVYVGDDPNKDFVSLRRVGATTVRVHTGRFADVVAEAGYDADLHVDMVTDVPALLGIESAGAG